MDQTLLLKRTYFKLGFTTTDGNGDLVVDDTCRFPLSATTLFIDDVLDEYNQLVPRKKIFKVESVVSGAPNHFGIPTEASNILGVYWQTNSEFSVSPDIPEVIHSQQYQYSDGLLETLVNTSSIDQISNYNRKQGVDYEIITGNTLRVLQRATVLKVYILYNYPRAITDVNEMARGPFSDKLAATVVEAYVSGKERSAGVSRKGITEYSGGLAYLELAEKWNTNWDEWISVEQKRAFVGSNDALVLPT